MKMSAIPRLTFVIPRLTRDPLKNKNYQGIAGQARNDKEQKIINNNNNNSLKN
jgi:hypothetical protein